jgi:hypothetical protein
MGVAHHRANRAVQVVAGSTDTVSRGGGGALSRGRSTWTGLEGVAYKIIISGVRAQQQVKGK